VTSGMTHWEQKKPKVLSDLRFIDVKSVTAR
jgi:hypothetical protein